MATFFDFGWSFSIYGSRLLCTDYLSITASVLEMLCAIVFLCAAVRVRCGVIVIRRGISVSGTNKYLFARHYLCCKPLVVIHN